MIGFIQTKEATAMLNMQDLQQELDVYIERLAALPDHNVESKKLKSMLSDWYVYGLDFEPIEISSNFGLIVVSSKLTGEAYLHYPSSGIEDLAELIGCGC